MSLAVWTQYTNVTDGQTDGQTPADSWYRSYAQRRAVKTFVILSRVQRYNV